MVSPTLIAKWDGVVKNVIQDLGERGEDLEGWDQKGESRWHKVFTYTDQGATQLDERPRGAPRPPSFAVVCKSPYVRNFAAFCQFLDIAIRTRDWEQDYLHIVPKYGEVPGQNMVMSKEWKELVGGLPRAPHHLQDGSVFFMNWFQPEPNFDSLAVDVSPEYPEMRAGNLSAESQISLKTRRLNSRGRPRQEH